jgi:hypothetical protein
MPAISTVLFTIGTYAITMGTVYTFVAMVALSYVMSSLNQPDGLKGTTQTDPGVRAQVPPDTTTPMPVVYGEAYLGGRFVDACITTDQKVMYYVMAISCISENGIFVFDTNNFYYGDRKITFDTVNTTTVASLTDGAGNVDTTIKDHLNISLYKSDKNGNITGLNTPFMPWDSSSILVMGAASGLPSEAQWAATGRRMNGLAFAIIRLDYNRDAGTTQLQPITYHCAQYLYTYGKSKPGDVWYDYMTNSVYGAAIKPEFVDVASAAALNTYSEELITFTDYDGNPQTQARYTINGVVDTTKAVLKNIDDIMQACDSWLRYEAASGKWSVTINKAETPALALNDNNIIGSIVVGTIDLAQTVNVIEAKFPDGTNRDQYNYVNEAVPPALLYPNEPVNKQTVTYELVNNSVQALYLANRVLEQGREDLTITVNTTYVGIQLSAGDIVTITNSAYGWSAKPFRCMQVQESVTGDGSLGAQLQLTEYNAQVYDNFDITQYSPSGNTGNPSSGYFSTLSPPAVVDAKPYVSVPTFSVNCAVPIKGRTTYLTLFYTTTGSPTASDWTSFGTQTLSNSQPFGSGAIVSFKDISLPAGNYHFAYKVGNESYSSPLSAKSTILVWTPDPANASSFTLTFNPSTLQVPYSGSTPSFAGVICKLYGQNGLGGVDFVPAQTDSDPTFVSGTWRIGATDSTGYGDIVKTNITVPDPTDGGTHADFGQPTAMPASTATMQVPVRYKDLAGAIHQVSPASIQYAYQVNGTSANKYATGYLYQWNSATPGNPNGTSIYTWADGSMSSYTGSNGWQTSIPSNPGIPLLRLWQASKQIVDAATVTTTTVSWTSGFTVADVTQNGAAGVQTATPTVYQWAITIPLGPTGSSTYTWATSSFTPTPSGWSLDPGTAPSAGYTLWGATVSLLDSATATTTSINWTTASITARGYAGTNGSTGTTGASARICYTKTTLASLNSTPTTITTSGSTSFPPAGSWGAGTSWQATPPSIVAGESVYQSDGIYDPSTGNTVWNVPYLSALKVGSLSAISANLGTVTAGTITGVTITGGTIQTATSGVRTVLQGSNNTLTTYDSGGIAVSVIGGAGSGGGIAVNTTVSGTSYPNIAGYSAFSGSGAITDVPCLLGSNTIGTAIRGDSNNNGIGVCGVARTYGGSNHGLRGVNTAQNGGTSTGGLVGVANGYDFYADGSGVNYGPFTGSHDVMVAVGSNIGQGYIVKDVACLVKKNVSNTVFSVALSDAPNEPSIGVMVLNNGLLANQIPAAFVEKYEYIEVDGEWETKTILYPEYDLYKNDYDYCSANAVGEGQVYVCGENGNIAAGDLIVTSSVAGVGMKQADDIVRNYTVAKAREALIFTDTTTPVLVACIYLCG